jgi:hypothetical protein
MINLPLMQHIIINYVYAIYVKPLGHNDFYLEWVTSRHKLNMYEGKNFKTNDNLIEKNPVEPR